MTDDGTVLGIDFSGSKHAGDSIWVAEAERTDGRWKIATCWLARDKADSRNRDEVYDRLVEYILEPPRPAAVGVDFPFGLPQWALDAEEWEARVEEVAEFDSPSEMHDRCEAHAGDGDSSRRKTEGEIGGLSSYGWMLKSQTYYGITAFIPELMDDREVCFPPMSTDSEIHVIETYPGGTLDKQGLSRSGYKPERPDSYDTRESNLDEVEKLGFELGQKVRQYALCNDDAHDAVFATVATVCASENDFEVQNERYEKGEGYIYV